MILEMLEITTEYATCPCCHEQTVCRNTITTPDGHQRLIAGCIDPDCDNFNPAALLGEIRTLQQQNQRLQELNVEQMGQIRELQVQLADTPEQQAENNQSAWLAAMSGTHYDNLLKAQAEIKRLESENKIQLAIISELKQLQEDNIRLNREVEFLSAEVSRLTLIAFATPKINYTVYTTGSNTPDGGEG